MVSHSIKLCTNQRTGPSASSVAPKLHQSSSKLLKQSEHIARTAFGRAAKTTCVGCKSVSQQKSKVSNTTSNRPMKLDAT